MITINSQILAFNSLIELSGVDTYYYVDTPTCEGNKVSPNYIGGIDIVDGKLKFGGSTVFYMINGVGLEISNTDVNVSSVATLELEGSAELHF